ncbi:hypothetical protein LTR50_003721 [Elasticomyces elasticus]|nr:hypothetical protein LTR50_003721 [Elasticomyces elasticus]
MSWLSTRGLPAALPDHCEPTTDFLFRFSSTFHTCVPTNLALISTTLGTLSIVSWLFAQLPQIYRNYKLKSTSGLSIFFLVEWCLGDLSNLLGAIFARQATWQMVVAGYYCLVDFMLVVQWVWYEYLQHGQGLRRVWSSSFGHLHGTHGADGLQEVIIQGVPASSRDTSGANSLDQRKTDDTVLQSPVKDDQMQKKETAIAWRIPGFHAELNDDDTVKEEPSSLPSAHRNCTIRRVRDTSPMPSPSPRTILYIACLIAIAQASPLIHTGPSPAETNTTLTTPSPLENAGTALSWLSTLLYLFSRLPQLFKNYRRRSTSGLSPHLFLAAFFGNLFYSSSILANPCAWNDYDAYGGGGWVGAGGSSRTEWIARALPFWLGAAGVLVLDAAVGVQFLLYAETEAEVVAIESSERGTWRWRRVSGWYRGLILSVSVAKAEDDCGSRGGGGGGGRGEEDALLAARNRAYGTGFA